MKMRNNKNILVTVSGGKTSAFMAIFLKERFPDKNLLFVFANTGKEREETFVFLRNLDKYFNLGIVWLEAKVNKEKGVGTTYKIVDFETASRNGEPFEAVIKKYGLPSKLYRHCTRELKERPIDKYAKEVLGRDYLTAVGIRADEPHRIGKDPTKIYPLEELNIEQRFVNDWWNRQPFNLNLKEHEGNCDFCFLKSQRKRVFLLREGLNVDWWNKMEIKYGNDRQPMFDVRNDLTIENLIEINNTPQTQLSLLDDIGFDCFCKAS